MFPLVCREQDGHKPKASKPYPQRISLLLMFCGFFIGEFMRLVYGFGVNDADYVTQKKQGSKYLTCPAYMAWRNMIKRVFSKTYQRERPTYKLVTVCDEWRSFMSFREWWLENHVGGWQIDKDLLSEKKLYSPETCIYVPAWLNSFTLSNESSRGDFPIGVCFCKSSSAFVVHCRNPITKKQERLGAFGDPSVAGMAWIKRKLEIAEELKPQMDLIDDRIYNGVVRIILSCR